LGEQLQFFVKHRNPGQMLAVAEALHYLLQLFGRAGVKVRLHVSSKAVR
jgi:hypothetical protein